LLVQESHIYIILFCLVLRATLFINIFYIVVSTFIYLYYFVIPDLIGALCYYLVGHKGCTYYHLYLVLMWFIIFVLLILLFKSYIIQKLNHIKLVSLFILVHTHIHTYTSTTHYHSLVLLSDPVHCNYWVNYKPTHIHSSVGVWVWHTKHSGYRAPQPIIIRSRPVHI